MIFALIFAIVVALVVLGIIGTALVQIIRGKI